jgi:hypothetical protein
MGEGQSLFYTIHHLTLKTTETISNFSETYAQGMAISEIPKQIIMVCSTASLFFMQPGA